MRAAVYIVPIMCIYTMIGGGKFLADYVKKHPYVGLVFGAGPLLNKEGFNDYTTHGGIPLFVRTG